MQCVVRLANCYQQIIAVYHTDDVVRMVDENNWLFRRDVNVVVGDNAIAYSTQVLHVLVAFATVQSCSQQMIHTAALACFHWHRVDSYRVEYNVQRPSSSKTTWLFMISDNLVDLQKTSFTTVKRPSFPATREYFLIHHNCCTTSWNAKLHHSLCAASVKLCWKNEERRKKQSPQLSKRSTFTHRQ